MRIAEWAAEDFIVWARDAELPCEMVDCDHVLTDVIDSWLSDCEEDPVCNDYVIYLQTVLVICGQLLGGEKLTLRHRGIKSSTDISIDPERFWAGRLAPDRFLERQFRRRQKPACS